MTRSELHAQLMELIRERAERFSGPWERRYSDPEAGWREWAELNRRIIELKKQIYSLSGSPHDFRSIQTEIRTIKDRYQHGLKEIRDYERLLERARRAGVPDTYTQGALARAQAKVRVLEDLLRQLGESLPTYTGGWPTPFGEIPVTSIQPTSPQPPGGAQDVPPSPPPVAPRGQARSMRPPEEILDDPETPEWLRQKLLRDYPHLAGARPVAGELGRNTLWMALLALGAGWLLARLWRD